jgi:hypothetical protein
MQANFDLIRFNKNLDLWRIILVVLVVINHVLLITLTDNISDSERAWVVLTRAGVPALSLFSGYLLAGEPTRTVTVIARKKFGRLVTPFLFWNSLCAVGLMIVGEYWPGSPASGWSDLNRYDVVNGVTGFHGAPLNYPLYFLRDMFISAIAIGLLRPVLRHPAGLCAGIAVLLLNYMLDLEDRLILRNTIPLFLLAGFAMRLHPSLIAACRRAYPALAVAALLVLWICTATELDWGVPSLLDLLTLGIFAALVVGLAASLPPIGRAATWGRGYAFPIFLSHAWVLMGLDWLWQRQGWDDASFGAVAMAGALSTGILVARLADRLPAPLSMALAGRRSARRPQPRDLAPTCAAALSTPVA